MRDWVAVVAVYPQLRHKRVRPKALQQRHHRLAQRPQIYSVGCVWIQRQVDRIPPAPARARLLRVARSRKQKRARFVHRHRHHRVGVIESVLNAVPVVAVYIHIRHAHPRVKHALYANHRVVEHAEPVGIRGHSMMQAARYAERHIRLVVQQRLNGGKRRAGRERRGVVHPLIRGVVAGPKVEPGLVNRCVARAQPLHCVRVFGRVIRQQVGALGGLRAQQRHIGRVKRAVCPQQVVCVAQSRGFHRMGFAQHMPRKPVVIHKRRSSCHNYPACPFAICRYVPPPSICPHPRLPCRRRA